ncbi:FAD-binding protein [Nitratireductor sp. CAU 1489]|uniref:FAD-binding protein n=1 Tax=Nitratireductor arenosus TaxID=2682096 RepID=A0A844QEE4_9HYPH|nr:FAD-binding oxidoreductase [Nitratireductor arenosus]MVA98346.1 FAD-binding protein [Nitratireductor arenosus]
MNTRHHIDALRALLGDKGIVVEAGDKQIYETGARYDRGRAAFVARPANTQEVSTVVGYCVRHDIGLVAQSGNTGLVSGSTPDDTGTQAVLSLDRLAGITEIDPVNRSVRAGAGVRLSALNTQIEADGLFFPIDLSADPRLGGMIATNAGGSRFLRYGDVRANTLGIEVVLADEEGTILDFTSGLRKNNVGVDWKQIFIGTCGAFGIITQCVLNLEMSPCQSATALLVPSSEDAIPNLLVAMEQACGAHLSAFEGMSGNAIRAALAHVPSLRNPFEGGAVPDFAIMAEITRCNPQRSGEQALDSMLEDVLTRLWESDDAPLANALVGPPEEMWALRHALSEGVKSAGRLFAFDLSFRRGDVMLFLAHMKAELARSFPAITVCDFGHLGDGGVHFNLVARPDDPALADPGYERSLRNLVMAVAVEKFHGSFSAEHGIGRMNQVYYDRYTPDPIRRLATNLKRMTSPGALGAMTL